MSSHLKKVEFSIFRHGETDWNKLNRFQGHTDIPLNEVGLQQAESLRPILKKLNPEIVVSSDLQRAVVTAKVALADMKIPLTLTEELRECNLGKTEGLYRDEILQVYSEELLKRWSSVKSEDLDFGLPGGETKRAHEQRLIQYLRRFHESNPLLSRIAVSTHGGSLRRIIHFCENAPSHPIETPNCALYVVHFFPEADRWVWDSNFSAKTIFNVSLLT